MIFPTIKKGSSGQTVRYLQDLLNRNGHSVTIDGSFGPGTETEVKKLQTKLGQESDGIVGPKSWEAFSKASFKNGKVCQRPKITEDLIPILEKRRSGQSQTPQWITIHNTGNPKSTALGERGWLLNPSNDRIASWHYAVDQIHAVLVIPEEEIAWHAGNTTGNTTSIGIEVCESGDQEVVWNNAVGLTASLLYKYDWGIERVTTHNRWSGKVCPWILLKRWNEFLADVEATLNAMREPEPIPEPEPSPEPVEDPVVEPEPTEEPTKEDAVDYNILNRILKLLEDFLKRILGR